MEELLERLLEECRPTAGQGHVADYIPELAKGDPDPSQTVLTNEQKFCLAMVEISEYVNA